MKRGLLVGTAVLVLLYLVVQVYALYKAPFVHAGHGTIATHTGETVILSVLLRNKGRLPFKVTEVTTDATVFSLSNACFIQSRGRLFTGVRSADLPDEFRGQCVPPGELRRDWPYEYSLALQGQVVAQDLRQDVTVTISYRVLGLTHRVQYRLGMLDSK